MKKTTKKKSVDFVSIIIGLGIFILVISLLIDRDAKRGTKTDIRNNEIELVTEDKRVDIKTINTNIETWKEIRLDAIVNTVDINGQNFDSYKTISLKYPEELYVNDFIKTNGNIFFRVAPLGYGMQYIVMQGNLKGAEIKQEVNFNTPDVLEMTFKHDSLNVRKLILDTENQYIVSYLINYNPITQNRDAIFEAKIDKAEEVTQEDIVATEEIMDEIVRSFVYPDNPLLEEVNTNTTLIEQPVTNPQ